jgi:hypothetical protein
MRAAPADLSGGQFTAVFDPAMAVVMATGIEQENAVALLEGDQAIAAPQALFSDIMDLVRSAGKSPARNTGTVVIKKQSPGRKRVNPGEIYRKVCC